MMHCLLLLSTASLIAFVNSYHDGPPVTEDVCLSMFPEGHDADPQTSMPLWEIIISEGGGTGQVVDTYAAGGQLKIEIRPSTTSSSYKGVFLQMRKTDCNDQRPVGSFLLDTAGASTHLQNVDCGYAGSGNSVSHKTSQGKTNLQFTWVAPATEVGNLYIRATFVQYKQTFWTDVYSSYIKPQSQKDDGVQQRCGGAVNLSKASLAMLIYILIAACILHL